MDRRVDVSTHFTSGDTALYRAVSRDKSTVTKPLLGQPVDVDQRDFGGKMPLFKAVQRGVFSMVKALLARGVEIDLEIHGGTALSKAAAKDEY